MKTLTVDDMLCLLHHADGNAEFRVLNDIVFASASISEDGKKIHLFAQTPIRKLADPIQTDK